MSGINHGTRLERLEALAVATKQAIADERIRLARGEAPRPGAVSWPTPRPAPPPRPPLEPPSPDSLVTVPIDHVIPRLVRDWALTNGYTHQHTGPIGNKVRAAFIEAHR